LAQDAPVGNLALAADADGRAHALWQTVGEGVWYTRQQADGSWDAPRQLTTDYHNWGGNGPALALDGLGRPHFIWKSQAVGNDLYYFAPP
jgi:hypothetical protein